MTILVTGSAGHLGEALMRSLRSAGRAAIGMDLLPSPFTDIVGSICDRALVKQSIGGARAIIHSATLHKPHVASHTNQDFIETNITGTLVLLEQAAAANVEAFVFTSTTSAFGSALTPAPGKPAAWVTEEVVPIPRNIYGVTKVAAENLCEMVYRQRRLPTIVLRTSRFFPEDDVIRRFGRVMSYPTLRPMKCSIDALMSRMPSARICSRSSGPRRSVSAATSFPPRRHFHATTSPSYVEARQASCIDCLRIATRSSPPADGNCSPPSTVSTSIDWPWRSWDGGRDTTSAMCSIVCTQGQIFAARWRARWGARAITPPSSSAGRILSRSRSAERIGPQPLASQAQARMTQSLPPYS